MRLSKFVGFLASVVCVSVSRAETVAIDYVLESSVSGIDSFSIPNPQGGADITISPSITFDDGVFEALFFQADASGTIADGESSIIGLEISGVISIELSSTVQVFGFPVPVSATISGPLGAQQLTDSNGFLTGLTLYAETAVGDYSLVSGELNCSDSAFGVFCAAIETGLGIEFPLDGIAGNIPLPFAGGTFSNLNPVSSSAGSAVMAQIDFSFPLTADLSIGVSAETTWVEQQRLVTVPEPSVAVLLLASMVGCGMWRRRR